MGQILSGGWKTEKKSKPQLWKKVLAKVHNENPGHWAAWKSMKAVKIYKQLGGRYIR